ERGDDLDELPERLTKQQQSEQECEVIPACRDVMDAEPEKRVGVLPDRAPRVGRSRCELGWRRPDTGLYCVHLPRRRRVLPSRNTGSAATGFGLARRLRSVRTGRSI